MVTKDLFRTVSEINGNFGRKSQNFLTPLYLTTPLRGFPSEFCNDDGGQKLLYASTRLWKEFDDVCVHLDTIPMCDGQTDGRIF